MRFQLTFSLVTLSDILEAKEVNQRGKILIGDQWESYYEGGNLVICLATSDTLTQDEIVYFSPITDTLKKNWGSFEKGLAELHRLYLTENILSDNYAETVGWAAYLGDADFALDIIEVVTGINHIDALCF